MSKAVLIMDMPENCYKCSVAKMSVRFFGVLCGANNRRNEKMYEKPEWCPLREMPEKLNLCGRYNSEYYEKGGEQPSYKCGWNACLDAITGGT